MKGRLDTSLTNSNSEYILYAIEKKGREKEGYWCICDHSSPQTGKIFSLNQERFVQDEDLKPLHNNLVRNHSL